MDIIAELRGITARLDQEGADYALCGGLAMAVYAVPRATLDIDAISDAWTGRREIEWEGRKLKLVSPEGLILLKSFRRSGTDEDDIAYLRSIIDED